MVRNTRIGDRKRDHVEITLREDVAYTASSGFDRYRLRHNALPELDWESVSCSHHFLGRDVSFPLFISSMTGGYAEGNRLNELIAEFCQHNALPFGVGSQRVMLEDTRQQTAFSELRRIAPDAFICGNIGGVQLIGADTRDLGRRLIDPIRADALIVHLNPLQEMLQPEGDRNFQGVLKGIANLVKDIGVPVIVKETGAGIDGPTALRLLEAGVAAIDVAGAGGTSWAKVELMRYPSSKISGLNRADHEAGREKGHEAGSGASGHAMDAPYTPTLLAEWGIATADCLREVSPHTTSHGAGLIASGGIREVRDMLIAMCLGADLSAMAQPVLTLLMQSGLEGLQTRFEHWCNEFRTALLLLGCPTPAHLCQEHLLSS